MLEQYSLDLRVHSNLVLAYEVVEQSVGYLHPFLAMTYGCGGIG